MTPELTDPSEKEKMALDLIREQGSVTRDTVVSKLRLRTNEEASDIMRQLRYQNKVEFSFEDNSFKISENK